ncbi:MAG: TldD/PmbA family protein [Candidatus Cloacimonetes bacterium]|nr:TldD/PmbA family protein [Candidatus Cloacimonadota bacterium]
MTTERDILLEVAMEAARSYGAQYADIRIQKTRSEMIYLRNLSLKNTSSGVVDGYGIRVLKDGAWGFAHNNVFSKDAVQATAKKAAEIATQSARVKNGPGIRLTSERSYLDTYVTPMEWDPFEIPLQEKVEMMLEVNKTLLNFTDIKMAMFFIVSQTDHKLFASTLGTRLDITTTFVSPYLQATAVTNGDSQSRGVRYDGGAGGWEIIDDADYVRQAPRIAEEAIMKCHAGTLGDERRMSLILDPSNLGLTMHESIGHPTELDRVLGWEADYAGISFATPEKLGNYKYGADIVNFLADNTLEGGLATMGYDDDGVPGQKWHIIKDGILVSYGTTRETAPFIGLDYSRGCNRATNYFNFPINRIPNLYLAPGQKRMSPEDLITDTEDGVMVEGLGSFSIDQHRVNFQFGGDLFWEIKNGKRTRMLKKVLYKSNNPEFWNACDAICDHRFWKPISVTNCGKGQPNQSGRMTHGAAHTRFRNIRVGGSQ